MDGILRTTTPIKYPGYELRDTHSTGFFYRTNHDLYLVTARHCLFQSRHEEDGPFKPDEISIRIRDKSKHDVTRSERIKLYDDEGNKNWIEPHYHHVDIAALPLDFSIREVGSTAFGTALFGKSYSPDEITGPGQSAIVAGYPILERDTYAPVLRNALISTALNVDFDSQPYFLIDSQLHEGTSGSPVIVHYVDRLELDRFTVIGVHSGRYDLNVEGSENLNRVWFIMPLRNRLNDIEPGIQETWG